MKLRTARQVLRHLKTKHEDQVELFMKDLLKQRCQWLKMCIFLREGGVKEIPPNEDTDLRDKIIEERDQVIRDQENTIQQQEMAYFTTNM